MLVAVGHGHHRFCNFDLGSGDMDGECRKVVVFSHLKGFYYVQRWGKGGCWWGHEKIAFSANFERVNASYFVFFIIGLEKVIV